MTAHGITKNWAMKKYVLSFKPFPGTHDGEAIQEIIDSILQQWDIEEKKIHAFITDSASNMQRVRILLYFLLT
jgi:hypothetical protein